MSFVFTAYHRICCFFQQSRFSLDFLGLFWDLLICFLFKFRRVDNDRFEEFGRLAFNSSDSFNPFTGLRLAPFDNHYSSGEVDKAKSITCSSK